MWGLFVLRHAEAVAQKHDVNVLFVVSRPEVHQVETETEISGRLKITRIYYPKSRNRIKALGRLMNVYRHIRFQQQWIREQIKAGNRPDLVHVHILTRSAVAAWWTKKKYGIPYLITEHWSRYIPGSGLYKGWLRKKATAFLVKHASAVTVVSHRLGRIMQEQGLKNPHYSKVYNVVNPDHFQIRPGKKEALLKKIIHISCFDESSKNITGMLRAVKQLSLQRQDFTFELIGDGPDLTASQDFAAQLAFPGNMISFTGLLEGKAVGEKLAEGNIFLLFSHRENMPVVLFEAFNCGIPVVSSDVGGIHEILDPERGILVPPGDEKALIAALDDMLERYSRFDPENIRAFSVAHTSPDAVRAQFESVYQSILRP